MWAGTQVGTRQESAAELKFGSLGRLVERCLTRTPGVGKEQLPQRLRSASIFTQSIADSEVQNEAPLMALMFDGCVLRLEPRFSLQLVDLVDYHTLHMRVN